MIKERPILFSDPMVRAILDDRKTQARRVINKQPTPSHRGTFQFSTYTDDEGIESYWNNRGFWHARCPYGKPGDRLWVREAFSSHIGHFGESIEYAYRATHDDRYGPWRPSIHMPRSASRILLEVTNVRVERLNDISEEDAIAEGLKAITKDGNTIKYGIPDRDGYPGNDDHGWNWCDWNVSPVLAYKRLWESINGKGSLDLNPFCWVIEFKVISK